MWLLRNIFKVPSLRNFSTVTNRLYQRSVSPVDVSKEATAEILKDLQDKEDLFEVQVIPQGPGTWDNPNVIPSSMPSRVIGCICDDASEECHWMILLKGEPQKCGCGNWFVMDYKGH